MRSRTLPDLPGRCPRCWVKLSHCICGALGRAHNEAEVVFVRHHWEANKSTNTARIALLVLERARLVEFGYDAKLADAEVRSLEGAALLYPGVATPAPAPGAARHTPSPARLIVLDGTWAQTRRMLRRLPALALLPRVSLPPPSTEPLGLRRGHLAEGLSTILATAEALELLEGPDVAVPLRRAAHLHVESVLAARGH